MNIYVAATLFAVLVLLYWAITEAFTMFFRLIGLPTEKARFQVISLLTGTGFTTRESEMILSSRSRRRLARVTMIFGYVFNITIVSALINIFVSMKLTELKSKVFSLFIPALAVAAVFYISRRRGFRDWLDRKIEKLAGLIERNSALNSVLLIDELGSRTIARVTLHTIPEALAGKPLAETGLSRDLNILVLAVEREGLADVTPQADTVFQPGDRVTLCGDYRTLCDTFDAKERFTDEA